MTKMLDKVSKLLAQAENAGTPEEAETFMAKVQKLASINNIDLAVARMHQAKRTRVQDPEERRFQVNPYNRRHNRKHFLELAMAICDVNDVKYLIGGNERALFCVGFPSDLDVVEALFAHLSVQMVTECDEALARGDNREIRRVAKTEKEEIAWDDRDWGGWSGKQYYDNNPDDDVWRSTSDTDESYQGKIAEARAEYEKDVAEGNEIYSPYTRGYQGGYRKPVPPPRYSEISVLDKEGHPIFETKEISAVDGRIFRGNFYGAFVIRMRGRLWEIRKSVERERGVEEETSEMAVAVRDKKAEVDKAHDDQRAKVHHLGTYRGSEEDERGYDYTGTARRAGHEAAARVPIDERGRGVKA